MCKNPIIVGKKGTFGPQQQDNRELSQKWTLLLNSSLFFNTPWSAQSLSRVLDSWENGDRVVSAHGSDHTAHRQKGQHIRERPDKKLHLLGCLSSHRPNSTSPWLKKILALSSMTALDQCDERHVESGKAGPQEFCFWEGSMETREGRGLYTKPPAQLHKSWVFLTC